ncbi:hypothetical protein CEXT_531861 [Caerostris extrusa]|uniref:Uncharacterized protein n=1 Tax=Caerostris extrusa TaxID=172846 RepID=A0AAV4N0V7_CAEEX|nr:hypothetical protein CEXT_531861 [Caerostris extrusa]
MDGRLASLPPVANCSLAIHQQHSINQMVILIVNKLTVKLALSFSKWYSTGLLSETGFLRYLMGEDNPIVSLEKLSTSTSTWINPPSADGEVFCRDVPADPSDWVPVRGAGLLERKELGRGAHHYTRVHRRLGHIAQGASYKGSFLKRNSAFRALKQLREPQGSIPKSLIENNSISAFPGSKNAIYFPLWEKLSVKLRRPNTYREKEETIPALSLYLSNTEEKRK